MKNVLFASVIPDSPAAPPGQQDFKGAGEYYFTVPPGVFSVCVAMVANGEDAKASPSTSGKGGNLRYQNNIPVVPGTQMRVNIGGGTTSSVSGFGMHSNSALSSTIKGANGSPGVATAGYNYKHGGNAGGYPGAERGAGIDLATWKYSMVDNNAYQKGTDGGGGGSRSTTYGGTNYSGGAGAVRVIWGPDRAFPDKNIGNL